MVAGATVGVNLCKDKNYKESGDELLFLYA
jgi:hypothetical protein